jgi:hypothetical protein
MTTGSNITYLRTGRHKRASGKVVDLGPKQTVKVKPDHLDWKHVWLTPDEIAAGREKPPIQPREKPATPSEKPKRERKPKAAPVPRWRELVDRVRLYEVDHVPDGWPACKMSFLTELADELEAAQTIFQKP